MDICPWPRGQHKPYTYLGSASLSLHTETISQDYHLSLLIIHRPYTIIIFSIEVHIVLFPTCNCLMEHLPSAITSVPSLSVLKNYIHSL